MQVKVKLSKNLFLHRTTIAGIISATCTNMDLGMQNRQVFVHVKYYIMT